MALVAPTSGPAGQATLDDVTLSNAGLSDGAAVVVAPARVEPARRVLLPGSRLARAALTPETVRLALVGKVVTGGDAVSLLPQDVEPAPGLDAPAARRRIAGALGSAWTTELLTVAPAEPEAPAEPVIAVEDLVGHADAAGKLVEWLELTLDRPDLLTRLGGTAR